MANTYNPYSDIQAVYNAKVAWNNATTDEERQKQNEVATSARKRLEAYGYSDVANQVSASGADATAARKIMEQYAPKTTTTTDTTPVTATRTRETAVNEENEGLFSKYNQTYEDLTKTNPFTTDEAKAILAKYDIAGLQGRDNAVASGGASNGGNIDSYAATNAMRQQAALVNQGQMAVLDAHQQKIDNIRGLLSDMGVNIDRVFNQDETAKNNEVARKTQIASVTGYAPDEWVVSNNPYMNDDGTIKEEFKDVDFSAVMANAKATGNTEAYNAAATARYYKIMSNYGLYGKYDDGNYQTPSSQKTEAAREFDTNAALANKELDLSTGTTKSGTSTKKPSTSNLLDDGDTPDDAWETFKGYFSDDKVLKFLDEKLKPYYDNGREINEEVIENLIVGSDVKNSNSTEYDIDVEDARAICNALGLDDSWVDKYKNRTWFNRGKGMKSAE